MHRVGIQWRFSASANRSFVCHDPLLGNCFEAMVDPFLLASFVEEIVNGFAGS
jgi:hypothetical protein